MSKMENTANKSQPKSHKPWQTVFVFLLMFLGLAMMFLPGILSRDEAAEIQDRVESFKELVGTQITVPAQTKPAEETPSEPALPQIYPELYQIMLTHNANLIETQRDELQHTDDFADTVIDPTKYGVEDGIVGLVSIPGIEVEMPLYLGGSYANLAKGFAQLSHTSMPTGGKDTNCVIACHRGWRGMAYLRDVEELDCGDMVYVQTLWDKLEYKISRILLIEPYELDSIYISPGEDLLTIVTCHPYGVGSHRYVLVCNRVLPEQEELPQQPTPASPEPSRTEWQWEWQDRVNITTGEGTTFHSSNVLIFITEYVPWICLGVAILISAMYLFDKNKKK